MYGNPKITKKNFIYNIRDYFILEKNGKKFVGYRNEKEFKKIKQEMEIDYPKLKEKSNLYISFFSFSSRPLYNIPQGLIK